MANLSQRISRRIQKTVTAFRADSRFSLRLALLRTGADLGGRIGLRKMANSAGVKKDEWIQRYLKNHLSDVLQKFSQDADSGEYLPDAPIWICWWTGEETAPPLVKQCIRSIRRHGGSHPIHMITKDNYSDYLDIPDYILEKVSSGSMCIANFSDYLRFSLLAKYGGLWLDTTIFCAYPLQDCYFSLPLFTGKGTLGDPGGYLSRYRWTSFCFGGHRGNVLFRYMQASFEAYWQNHNAAIDYLLVDYLINMAYDCLPACRQLLDQVPENNLHRDDLQAAMNAALPADDFSSVLQPDTALYKLSWRENYREYNDQGQLTVFGHYLNMKL